MDLPVERWLHTPGFVDEQTKHDVIAGAVALVSPSPYESLSLVLLEAWSHGVPTIASARSPVLVGQTRRSGGGLWYRSVPEYLACLDLLAGRPPLARALGRAGWRFARDLCWPRVIANLEAVLREPASAGATATDAEPTPGAPPRMSVAGLPGGPLQIAVDAGAEVAVAKALRQAGAEGLVHVVENPMGEGPDTGIRLPRRPVDTLMDRLGAMDLVVTADADVVAAARRGEFGVRIVSPDDDDLASALAQAAERSSSNA
jgi:hypothetical protein